MKNLTKIRKEYKMIKYDVNKSFHSKEARERRDKKRLEKSRGESNVSNKRK